MCAARVVPKLAGDALCSLGTGGDIPSHVNAYMCVCRCLCACLCVCVFVCVLCVSKIHHYIYIYVCLFVCLCVCVCVCVYVSPAAAAKRASNIRGSVQKSETPRPPEAGDDRSKIGPPITLFLIFLRDSFSSEGTRRCCPRSPPG